MKSGYLLLWVLCFNTINSKAQDSKEIKFVADTMTFTGTQKVLQGEYVETTLKNLSVVRMFKTGDNHYYLRFLVTTNFYFDKVDMLEIRSGNKSYYAENTRQFKVNKTTGLFIVEIYKNYIAQLKDEGITAIAFGKAETDFTRGDASQVRRIAKHFHESITPKK